MVEKEQEIITLNEDNIDSEHICCAIGNDKKNQKRASVKKAWLKDRFPEGHTFKKFDVRGKVFIEYVPAEYAWFPIEAPGYNFIQCLWASGRYKGKGYGSRLMGECEKDSRNHAKKGLVVVTGRKKLPFTVDKKFYLKKGFEVCDEAPPYFEMLVKKFSEDAPTPKFTEKAKKAEIPGKEGLTFFYTDMCPFNADYVDIMIDVAQKHGIKTEKIKVENLKQAKDLPTPFGIFSVFFNGKFLTHEVMAEKKFDKLLVTLLP
ncbi:MAG TPA: GNAT family N-acetyltransferase [Methanobacterium subterraneum]|uniref:GNAT family N-acetyltransferase n=1 Tax=Methanobacterium subterraneum TaxID=59277 RepID=A0A7J4TJG5_9EURY|nr:GNAT family N-acetyltransferase [Methanobacterium subterraneum]